MPSVSKLMKRLLFAAAISLSSMAYAGETFLLLEDTYDLPPPYSQVWSATPSDWSMMSEYPEVFIRGDGKHGDFFGILLVDCQTPENSEWLATGGYLSSNDVPSKAIGALRLKLCREGEGA